MSIPSLLYPGNGIPERLWQPVYITNILSVVFSGLTFILLAILLRDFGWTQNTPYIIAVAILFILIIFINNAGYHKAGRLIFCIVPVCLTMFLTVYMKLMANQSYITYFDSRYLLLAMTILPPVVFRLDEKSHIVISITIVAVCLLLFDFIHEMFSVGYYQKGFDIPSYPFISVIVALSFIMLFSGVILLKSITEKAERKLIEQNVSLQQKQHEIRQQHEELLLQREELLLSSERLEEANRLIHKQKLDLEMYNSTLEHSVQVTNHELSKTNEVLVKRNNDLMQFSYTLSHNLRGPVARLLGLTSLAQKSTTYNEITEHIAKSAKDLDEVLHDLGQILDMGTELYTVKETVSLLQEWKRTLRFLEDKIGDNVTIATDLSDEHEIWGVKAMVQSIFYNLLSNALKYKSVDRPLRIHLKALSTPDYTAIEFSDNGIGIDMEQYGKDIFKLYKRFHVSTQGKGVGLYLVKMQVEAMNGTIRVQSAVDAGTTFLIRFTKEEIA